MHRVAGSAQIPIFSYARLGLNHSIDSQNQSTRRIRIPYTVRWSKPLPPKKSREGPQKKAPGKQKKTPEAQRRTELPQKKATHVYRNLKFSLFYRNLKKSPLPKFCFLVTFFHLRVNFYWTPLFFQKARF